MVSNTQQTTRRRLLRDQKQGLVRKRKLRQGGTPSFPLDPEAAASASDVGNWAEDKAAYRPPTSALSGKASS